MHFAEKALRRIAGCQHRAKTIGFDREIQRFQFDTVVDIEGPGTRIAPLHCLHLRAATSYGLQFTTVYNVPRRAVISKRTGTKQALKSRFAAVRARPAHGDYEIPDPSPEEWLQMEWPKGESEPTKYW